MLIYIIIGNDRRPFGRLLEHVANIIDEDDKTDILVQHGYTQKLKRRNWTWNDFFDSEKHRANLIQADIIIAHAGAPTLK